MRSVEPDLNLRAAENTSWLDDLVLGVYQRSWFSEFAENVVKDPAWFSDVVDAHDQKLTDMSQYLMGRKLEHTAAYALQRDARYAYAGRKQLMAKGWDSSFEGQYHDDYAGKLLTAEEE
jgi:hypothetical protein